MLLTVTTTHRPATDLGYLLRKNPARVQAFELPFGTARVLYPEANEESCTAALLVEVDPVELVRGRQGAAGEGGLLSQYVNDRPYVASSFLSVAIARVFGSALAGGCKERPELANLAIPLRVRLPALPCRGGAVVLTKLFEPLGYTVSAEQLPLDETFPEWGLSSVHRITLEATLPLHRLLTHLYVLIPVLDDNKHYWVGDDEVTKLLRHGEGWLPTHPGRDFIVRRYLKHRRDLIDDALAQLNEGTEPDPNDGAASRDAEEAALEASVEQVSNLSPASVSERAVPQPAASESSERSRRDAATEHERGTSRDRNDAPSVRTDRPVEDSAPTSPMSDTEARPTLGERSVQQPSADRQSPIALSGAPESARSCFGSEDRQDARPTLNDQRLGSVLAVLRASGAARVLDLGCGEGRLLQSLLKEKSFKEIVGMDVSHRTLGIAQERLHLDRLPPAQRQRIRLLHGSLIYRDERLAGFDAAAVVEVIEHLDAARLAAFERVLFECARPRTIVITTPNREYNVKWETLPAGRFRHRDHRFEWTRAEFQSWASAVAERFGYKVRFLPVGPEDAVVGSPTQMGVFEATRLMETQ